MARFETRRARSGWSLQLAAICSIAFISGCSIIGSPTVENCSTNAECREAVGFGSVCTGDHLCSSTVSQNARCTKTSPRDLFLNPERYGDTIIVGTIFDDSQAKHLFRENSVALAAHEINGLGADKLEGRQIGLVHCTPSPDDRLDNLSQSEGAAAAARYLVDVIGVSTVIGPADSTSAKAVYEELSGSGTLVISPSATSTALSDIDADGLLWRTAPPDDLQAEAIATYLGRPPVGEDTGSGDVYVIYADDQYGRPLFENFNQKFAGKLVGKASFAPEEPRSLIDAIGLAVEGDAKTVLFFANQSHVQIFLSEVVQRPADFLDKTPVGREIFLPDSAAAADVIEGVAGLSEIFGLIKGTRPKLNEQSVAYRHFRGAYYEQFEESPDGRSYSSNSYDAAWLVFAGMEWSLRAYGEVTGQGLVEGLRQVSNGSEEVELSPLNWKQIGGLLRQGQSINVTGASGALDYESGTDELRTHQYEIWEYVGTKVKPNEAATQYVKDKLYPDSEE